MAAEIAGCVSPREFTPAAPTVPKPRLPRNDAYQDSVITGSLRPRFVWEPSTAQRDPIVYELQYSPDPKLETDVTTVKTSELTYQPPEPLAVSTVPPVGRRYYWRVRACLEESCSEYSRPWWVNLGRSAKDLNGDGYADVVVGAPALANNAGAVIVYFGGQGRVMDSAVDGVVANPSSGNMDFGRVLAAGGDFNGDGFGDIAISGANRVYVYLGGRGISFDTTYDHVFTGPAGDGFGAVLAFVGDVNYDGLTDLAVGSPQHGGTFATALGKVSLYYGSTVRRLDEVDESSVGTRVGEAFGGWIDGGDLDGDGAADVVVSSGSFADDFRLGPCVARVYRGGQSKIFGTIVRTFIDDGKATMCSMRAVVAGDIGNDGFQDVAVVENSSDTMLTMYLGDENFALSAQSQRMIGRLFTTHVRGIGDVNGDGNADIATGGEEGTYAYYGRGEGSAGLIVAASSIGASPQRAGDVNGDGFDDVVAGGSPVQVLLGGEGNSLDTVPDTQLTYPPGTVFPMGR